MTKRYLHNLWRKLRSVNPWLLSALFLISFGIYIYALRQNDLTTIKLRDAVYQADQQNGDVEAALRNLREFIYSHMGTSLTKGANAIYPPIQLKYRYDRLVAAERARVEALNSRLYTNAQNYCEQQFPHGLSGSGRIPCVQQYIAAHGGVTEQAIPDALYKFDFVPPVWSPDLAGFSLLAAMIFLLLFIVRLALGRWFKE